MDIAQIGFKADTADLDKAVLKLQKLQNASKGIATSTNEVSRSAQGVSKTMAQASLEVARASSLQRKANLDALTSSKQSTKAQIDQAKQALKLARAEESAARSILQTAKANERLNKITSNLNSTRSNSFNQAAMGGPSRGPVATGVRIGSTGDAAIPRDRMPNRFNTANIAAQFQDIGVTAAMGMNPLTVALQQGTQLSAILNSMESPLKGLRDAFRSIINPVSLVSIGLTALTVALIQTVDWSKVAKVALNTLADVVEMVGPYVLGLAAALALIYSPAIVSGILLVTKNIVLMGAAALASGAKMAAAWVIGMGPVGWVVAGITVALTAMYAFRDSLANLIGVDVVGNIKKGVNFIVGLFVGAFESIKETWKMLPKAVGGLVIEAANNVLGTIESLIQKSVDTLNKLKGVNIKIDLDGQGDIVNPFKEEIESAGAEFGKIMGDATTRDYLGKIGGAITTVAGKLRTVASGIGNPPASSKTDFENKSLTDEVDAYDKIIKSANQRIKTLELERASLGMTKESAAALKYEQELLNDAMQKNIELSPEQRRELKDLSETMAKIEEETRKAKEAIDFAKDTSKGFFKDLRSSIQEGKSLWESFADAAVNALNRILDKMMDDAIDNLYESMKPKSSGIFGTLLNSVTGGFLGGFGGGGGVSASISQASARGAANPALYGPGFAKGGAFSNGIYSSPTLFKFANGGQFGVMGEAGPEAVMPLHRGPDGSLGVKMNGESANNNTNVTYNVDARGSEAGVEARIELALRNIEQLRKDTPKIAVESVKNTNSRNLGLLR